MPFKRFRNQFVKKFNPFFLTFLPVARTLLELSSCRPAVSGNELEICPNSPSSIKIILKKRENLQKLTISYSFSIITKTRLN